MRSAGRGRARRPDRGPQAVDRDRYGYPSDADELLLVREDGEELWIPYSGEPDEELDALVAEARERPEWEPPPAARTGLLPAPLRRFLVGIGLIGALALVLWIVERNSGWSGLSADDPRRSDGAHLGRGLEGRRQAGHGSAATNRVSRVGAVQHSDGVAIVGGDLAYLTPERCFDLYRLAFEGEITSSRTARALAVLAHETWHLRGIRDEGTTECYALQSGVDLGRRLGLSAGTARQMMRQQLTENLQHRGSSLEYLVPADCRDGGRLDLDPRSSRFP